MFLYLFPFLFSMTAFLLYLNNGDIINSIFFFFGLLLTILLGYIFKVMKIGTKQKKEINNICGVLLPNSLFEISTISISQLFYGYIISYIFIPKFLKMEDSKVFGFIFLVFCWLLDGYTFYNNNCSDINEIIFGVFLGVFLGIFMLIVKKRYYGIEKPYKKPICSLMGNKYKCKKTEEKEFGCDNYENNYDCASGEKEKTKSNVLSCIVGITSIFIIFLTFFLVRKSVEKEPNAPFQHF